MPFTRPSLQQILERILSDISLRLGEKASILRRAWTRVWSTAYAGAVHMLYGYIGWAKDQFFIASADDEYVIKKADFYGLTRNPAIFAYGQVDITGTNGAILPQGSAFINSAGTRYITQASATITSGAATVAVKAFEAGIKGNLPSGTSVALESPVSGVNNSALVNATTPIQYGSDLETIEALKKRLASRIQTPPQGGAKSDYEAWAREEPGLGQVIVYAPGEISTNPFIPPYGWVYVYFSEAGSTATPSSGKIDNVKNKILAKMPVTARLEVFGINFVTTNFNIQVKPATGYTFQQAKDDITNELNDYFSENAIPNATLSLSNINQVISSPASEDSHVLVAPAANLSYGYDQMGRVGTITFTQI